MRRILLSCVISLILYAFLFAFVLDRPLSLGLLRKEIVQKTDRLAALPSPKIVILAGSNGPYSHSCAVIGRMLNLPCENAGIAVGIGLDDLFARYAPLLRKGDIVYMPMELQQYTASRGQYRAAVDGGILIRHDRDILLELPLDRILSSVFCCNLADFLEAFAEAPITLSGATNPAHLLATQYNIFGDRIDNSLAAADPALLHHPARLAPNFNDIAAGYGSFLIRHFVAQEAVKGVIVVGGLPTDFATMSMPPSTIDSISRLYLSNGGAFLVLRNRSLYPAGDFFNGEDHLTQPCQFLHSIFVAKGLSALLGVPIEQPPASMLSLAQSCPSAQAETHAINAAR